MERLLNVRGVCLTEAMLSLAIGAIVLAASFDLFHVFHRQTVQQQRTFAYQQDLRIGLEVLEQEIRLATGESIVTASPDEFLFNANVNAQYTTTMGPIISGQSTAAVHDGSGWGAGKEVMLCGRTRCETHRLARTGQRHQLTFTEPVNQQFPDGTSIEVMNRVAYYTKRDEHGAVTLMRMVDGGAAVLIGGLERAQFSYWDDRGVAVQSKRQIKRVVVEMKLNHSSSQIVKEVGLRS